MSPPPRILNLCLPSRPTGTVPRRIAAGKLDKRTYRKATAFECLLGALHLADPGRAATLLERLVGALGRLPT